MLALAGVAPAAAQTAPSQPGGFDDVMRTLNLKARTTPAPDFVVKSRPSPAKLDYVPVGARHPERTDKVMTPAELAAAEAGLDAARTAQQRRAGVKPPPVPDKPKKSAGKAATTGKTLP